MDVQIVVRATELAFAIGTPLVRLLIEELDGGLDEIAATRRALERLAAMPDLSPVLPRVQAMIAEARSRATGTEP